MDIRISRLAGWFCGILAMVAAGWLIMGTVTLPGVAVPARLDTLVKASKVEGYKPPAEVASTCVLEEDVTASVRKDIKKVTGKEAQKCDFLTDARQHDAIWGALVAFLVAAAAISALTLAGGNIKINSLVLLVVLLITSLGGAIFWPAAGDWMEERGIVAAFFWRGFLATLAVAGSMVGAHQWHKAIGHD